MTRTSLTIRRILIFIVASFIFSALPLQAQFSGDIDITFTPQTEEVTVGDLVELTLAVKHPAGYQVILPQLPQVWGEYEVRSQTPPKTTSNGDGTETTSQTIVVTLFAPGIHQTPSLNLSLRDTNGQILERVAPQVSLTVTPVLGPDDTELRDIKPQFVLPVPVPWLWLMGSLLLALVLGVLAWWLNKYLLPRLRKQPEMFMPLPVIDTRPAYQIAYEELDRIERLDLPGQGRFKEYYSLVTDCLRRYLGGMYQVPAIDLTTWETKQALKHTAIAPEYARQFIDLFSEGDLVKFARFIPNIKTARSIIGQARLLIDVTKVIEIVEEEEEAATSEAEIATQEAV